jgi:sugar/nucleoside kinase (ribokinase family)
MDEPVFVAVGDLMVDIGVSGRGHDARISVAAGGSAANAAVWAAACDAEATVVGRVGDDLAGRALRAALDERGVRAELAVDAEAPTGSFLLVDGEIRADRGANARFVPEHLPERIDADAVLVSGYLPSTTVAAALERTEAGWTAVAHGLAGEPPPRADAVVLDEDEARRLTGAGPEEAARSLGSSFRLACVTCGEEGAVAVLDGRLETSSAPLVDAARSTGAGDAFAAGLLVALAGGADLAEALATACRLGAAAAASSDGWPVTARMPL